MSERSFVIVSRKWNNFEIKHRVVLAGDGKEYVRIESDLWEFMEGAARDIAPWGLRWLAIRILRKGAVAIVQDMKYATRFNPPPLVLKE